MCEISDEMLMAYADGEISVLERNRVEAYLAADPAGGERLSAFTGTGRDLGKLFDRPMREPVPQRLIEALAAPSTDAQSIIPIASRSVGRRRGSFNSRQWALAASFAVLLGAGTTVFWLQERGGDAGGMFGTVVDGNGKWVAGSDLAALFEALPSGTATVHSIAGETIAIKPIFTFASNSSEYCRQYEIVRADKSGLTGVACRQSDHDWRIEAQVASAPRPSASGGVVPAGKESAAAVDAAVDRLISGDVLGVDEEARAMADGWRAARP